jgi:hypothetical protein
MCAMNQGSLPSLTAVALRFLPGAIARGFARLFEGLGRRRGGSSPENLTLRSLAASAIREYAEAHAALFERAERLREKAERLEREGTPSESASNRAERARREVEAGLAALRASFAASAGGRKGRHAFDREVERRYPAFRLSNGST